MTDGFGLGGLLVAVVAAIVGGLHLLRAQPLLAFLLGMPAVTTLGLTALLGQPLRPRFLFNLSGGAALVVAFGLWTIASYVAARQPARAATVRSVVVAAALVVLLIGAAPAIARNAVTPKQDFVSAMRVLDAAAARGETVVGTGGLCFALEPYFERDWPCAETYDAWVAATAPHARVVAFHTLLEFWHDPRLIDVVTRDCRDVARFPGTVARGDVVVCEAPGGAAAAPR